jgi:hypothetical protein
MIKATYGKDPYSDRMPLVVAGKVPEVGETIDLQHWGECKVISLYHNPTVLQNYIELQYTKTCSPLKAEKFTCHFEVG